MNKLKHHFLGGLVFLGTISFGYIGYSAYTSLSTQTDGAVITKDIWNNVITTINDIGNRTDGIYSNNGNITIGNGLNNPISKINIYDKDNAGENVSIYKTTTSPNLDVYSTYDGSDDIQSGAIRYGVRPSDDSWQIWDKKSGSNWNNLVSVNSNGNVGIGTTTPTSKLDVKGNIKSQGIYNVTDTINIRTIFPKSNANAVCPSGSVAISTPWSYRDKTGNQVCSSDARGKYTCAGVVLVYITNANGYGTWPAGDLTCGSSVNNPWPRGSEYGTPNTLDGEWSHGNTYVICCK